MKKIAFYLLLLLSGVFACSKDSGNSETKITSEAQKSKNLIKESGLIQYYMAPPNTTWHDLDTFYENGVEKYRDQPQLHNFKCAAILCMVKYYNILDDQSDNATERIAYYAQEMVSLMNCNPETLFPMLIRLQGHWSPEKIIKVAATGYNNSLRAIKYLDNDIPEYKVRKKGMEDLKSLFETRQ